MTKRGTNQFSGALFSYNTGTAMTAKDFLTQQAGGDKPENSKYEFGGVLGGPVIRDTAHSLAASSDACRIRRGRVSSTPVRT